MNETYSRDTRPSMYSMEPLENEYNIMIEGERRRHEFVEKLMAAIETLSVEREEALRKLARLEFTCDNYQSSLEVALREKGELQKAMDCDRFVLILIDGDNTLFLDNYINDGAAGGERAARDLRQSIFDHLKDKPYFQHDYNIVIRLYSNLQGLAKTYNEAKIITNQKQLQDFVQAFNKSHALAEIIDAGNDKEAADSKIKATFNLYRRNVHCKHIMFSGSGDNSYAGFLRQYIPVNGISQHITLIEALPFTAYLEPLSHKFQTARFPKIFRDSKIIAPRPSNHETLRPAIPEQPTPPTTWATAMKAALPTIPARASENVAPIPAAPNIARPASTESGRFIFQNNKGQRVDKPVDKNLFDKEIVYRLKGRKMCNKYWLLGSCDMGEWCTHEHKGALSPKELENLKFVARMRPCNDGLDCMNPDCFDGHRCQHGMKCVKKDCWFTDEMHDVEHIGVTRVPLPEWS